MSVYLSDYLSEWLAVRQPVCLNVCACLSECLSIWMPDSLSACLSECLSIWMYVYLSEWLSVCMTVYLLVRSFICVYTGWLRNKCPTGEKAISLQSEGFWYQNFRFYGGDSFGDAQRIMTRRHKQKDQAKSKFSIFQLSSSQNLSNRNVVSATRNVLDVFQRLW